MLQPVGPTGQDIENGPDPQLATHRGDILHGNVIILCQKEAQSDFLQQPSAGFFVNLNIHSQSLEHISRATG
jgi:hypothetical protein